MPTARSGLRASSRPAAHRRARRPPERGRRSGPARSAGPRAASRAAASAPRVAVAQLPARAAPTAGMSSHTVRAPESNVNVATAGALHPKRAHCRFANPPRDADSYLLTVPVELSSSVAIGRRTTQNARGCPTCKTAGAFGFPRRRPTSAPHSTRSRSRSTCTSRCSPAATSPRPRTIPRCAPSATPADSGPLCVRARFPGGRGLGYSAAAPRRGPARGARAAGPQPPREARAETLRAATELEGHADNAAAALYGGVVAVAGRHVVRIPLARELAVVVWIPQGETATASARRLLPDQVSVRRRGVQRRPHRAARRRARRRRGRRDARRDRGPAAPEPPAGSRAATHACAIDAMLDAGAFAAWLSGSGPSAAAFVDRDDAARIAAALPSEAARSCSTSTTRER